MPWTAAREAVFARMVPAGFNGNNSMSETPIVSVVGKSNSGKTTLIEKLIPYLVARGHRVATIKHHAHSVDIDYKGKDSYRHREAGALAVVLTSPEQLFLTRKLDREPPLEEIRDTYLSDSYDLIITEGFKQGDAPKIEVNRLARSPELICKEKRDHLIAVVSDQTLDLRVPAFQLDDIEGIARFIEKHFL